MGLRTEGDEEEEEKCYVTIPACSEAVPVTTQPTLGCLKDKVKVFFFLDVALLAGGFHFQGRTGIGNRTREPPVT